jgi:hypothetical protein
MGQGARTAAEWFRAAWIGEDHLMRKPNHIAATSEQELTDGELSAEELGHVTGGDFLRNSINNFSQTLESRDKLGNTQTQISSDYR